MHAERISLSTCVVVGTLIFAAGCDRDPDAERAGVVPPIETPGPARPTPDDTMGDTLDRAGESLRTQGDRIATAIDDAAITARVKAAFVADPALTASKIEVQSEDGVVTLRGDVESTGAVDRAGVVARETGGADIGRGAGPASTRRRNVGGGRQRVIRATVQALFTREQRSPVRWAARRRACPRAAAHAPR